MLELPNLGGAIALGVLAVLAVIVLATQLAAIARDLPRDSFPRPHLPRRRGSVHRT